VISQERFYIKNIVKMGDVATHGGIVIGSMADTNLDANQWLAK